MSISSMTSSSNTIVMNDAVAVDVANPVEINHDAHVLAQDVEDLAPPRPRTEAAEVASRLHTMLDAARPTGKLQCMDGKAFAQIKEKLVRPPLFKAGYKIYSQILSAAKACDKASAGLDAIPLNAFKESPMGNKAFAALKKFTDAQNNLYATIQKFQVKTGSEAVILETMKAASQFRASEAMNYVATMQMMQIKEDQQQAQPHLTSTTFGGGMQELSHTMHGTQSVVNELVDTATDLFTQIDNLDSAKAAMLPEAFSEKIESISADITALVDRVTTIMTEGGIEIPKRDVPVADEAAPTEEAAPTDEAVPMDEAAPAEETAANEAPLAAAAQEDAPIEIECSAPKLNVDSQAFASLRSVLTGAQERLTNLAKADPLDGVKTAVQALIPPISEDLIEQLSYVGLKNWKPVLERYNRNAQVLREDADKHHLNSETLGKRLQDLASLLVPTEVGSKSFRQALGEQMSYFAKNHSKDSDEEGAKFYIAKQMRAYMSAVPISAKPERVTGMTQDILAIMDNASSNEQAREGYIKAAFEHDLDMGFVLEAALRKIPLEHLNLHASDTLLTSEKTLGQGAANTVSLCHYKEANGTMRDFVFKPEYAGRSGFEHIRVAGLGYAAQTQLMNLNLAANAVAQAIGCGDVIAESSIGYHAGKIGLFMEHAKGVTAKELGDGQPCGTASNGKEYNFKEVMVLAKSKGQLSTLQGNIAKALCKLEWADALSGQVDRHGNNYLVHVDPDTFAVKVTGIDNDASFSVSKVGMQKFALGATGLSQNRRLIIQRLGEADKENQAIRDFAGLSSNKGNADYFREALGLNQFAKPKQIDRETYTKLMAIDVDEYTASLEQYMPTDAVNAAKLRLIDSKAHAEQLSQKGFIVDSWTTKDTLDTAANMSRKTPHFLKNFFNRDFGTFFPSKHHGYR